MSNLVELIQEASKEKLFQEIKRSNLPDESFGIPELRKYPLDTEEHVISAIKLFNHVEEKYEKQLADNINRKIIEYDIDWIVVGPTNKFSKYCDPDLLKENYLNEICLESSKEEIWKNDDGKIVPKVCPKCNSKVGLFMKGEPVYLCTNKDCGKYFGTKPFDESAVQSVIEADTGGYKHFQMELLDIDSFIKANEVSEITDPVFFVKDGVPTPQGLLSNEIFGITKDERANIFGYIDLHGTFMNPLCYKLWSRMDSKIVQIAHGTQRFSINDNGELVEDENGETGIKFLKDNIDKIKIKETGKRRRSDNIKFLMANKDRMFITKYIVIPPYYRDANTSRGSIGVGQLNKYYSALLISVRSLKETEDYGLSMSDAVKGRIQETILNIYNCLCGTSNNADDGIGLSKKKGLIRNTIMSKTTDYGSRLVLSAPNLKVENIEDMIVDIDHSAIPLASALTNFLPYVIFNVKRFFENEFNGNTNPYINSKGEIENVTVKDPLVNFSSEVIKKEINRFIHGYSNRFIPIEIPLEDGRKVYMKFKGHNIDPKDIKNNKIAGESPLIDRRLTWCDVFYIAACEAVKDKTILITRFPISNIVA